MNFKFVLSTALMLLSGLVQAKHHPCNPVSVEQAAQNCNYDQMKHALKHSCGADLGKALIQSLKCTGKKQARHLAELLLEKGAPVNAVDAAGRTGLMLAVIACNKDSEENKKLVKLFGDYHANVCARDNDGKTAADLRTACCKAERVDRVLKMKCN